MVYPRWKAGVCSRSSGKSIVVLCLCAYVLAMTFMFRKREVEDTYVAEQPFFSALQTPNTTEDPVIPSSPQRPERKCFPKSPLKPLTEVHLAQGRRENVDLAWGVYKSMSVASLQKIRGFVVVAGLGGPLGGLLGSLLNAHPHAVLAPRPDLLLALSGGEGGGGQALTEMERLELHNQIVKAAFQRAHSLIKQRESENGGTLAAPSAAAAAGGGGGGGGGRVGGDYGDGGGGGGGGSVGSVQEDWRYSIFPGLYAGVHSSRLAVVGVDAGDALSWAGQRSPDVAHRLLQRLAAAASGPVTVLVEVESPFDAVARRACRILHSDDVGASGVGGAEGTIAVGVAIKEYFAAVAALEEIRRLHSYIRFVPVRVSRLRTRPGLLRSVCEHIGLACSDLYIQRSMGMVLHPSPQPYRSVVEWIPEQIEAVRRGVARFPDLLRGYSFTGDAAEGGGGGGSDDNDEDDDDNGDGGGNRLNDKGLQEDEKEEEDEVKVIDDDFIAAL